MQRNVVKEAALSGEEGDCQGAEPEAKTRQPGRPAGMFGE